MTTYPASWPLPDKFRTRNITPDFNQAVFQGEFSRHRQVQQHAGGKSDRWTGVWTTVNLDPSEIAQAEGFLWSLKGLFGTFYAYDPDRRWPLAADASSVMWIGDSTTFIGDSTTFIGAGILPGIGAVNGGGQTGNTLAVTFDVLSSTVMNVGDYFQVGVGFHALTAPALTDGSGNVTLEFETALRVSPADNDLVITINPVMVAQLDVQYPGGDTGPAKYGVVSFSFSEVVQDG